jgi:histidinol phosphatase-like PHP family hydrolase
MAAIKVNGKTVKAKVKSTPNISFTDEKMTGPEPIWDTERASAMPDGEFENHLRRSMNYYNYYFTPKDLKKYVIAWAKTTEEFDADETKLLDRMADRAVPMTVCSLIMSHRKGMPFREKHLAHVISSIRAAIKIADESPEEETKVIAKVYAPTIQDRLNEKTAETIGELEWHYDEMLMNPKSMFKPYDFLVASNVPQSQLGKYEAVYQKRLAEWTSALKKEDEQLVESYSHLKPAEFKRMIGFMNQILADITQYRGVKKATKAVRIKKAPTKDKLVTKLKFAKEDKTLRIVSIPAIDIVGAQELFVYNIKTRKLGRYVADDMHGPLSVKGTSVIGYNETKSTSKTLRKPADQLKEFAKASKVQTRKFVDEIKATAILLNGRINIDTILLKVL